MRQKLLIIGVIIFTIMAVENWGLLTKSQEDPETIEEAITRIVSAHNDDPESHLGEGKSLEAHRANEILDHKPGSVLADKWTMSEFDFSTQFESLAGFVTNGSVSQVYPGVQLWTNTSGSGNRAKIAVPLEDGGFVFHPEKDFLVQFVFNTDTFGGGTFLSSFGWGVGATRSGVGITVVNDVLKFYTSDENANIQEEYEWPDYEDVSITYLVRIQHIAGDDFVSCYVNGVKVAELDWPFGSGDSDIAGAWFYVEKTGSSSVLANIHSVYWSTAI